jgi:hypothetical protein
LKTIHQRVRGTLTISAHSFEICEKGKWKIFQNKKRNIKT